MLILVVEFFDFNRSILCSEFKNKNIFHHFLISDKKDLIEYIKIKQIIINLKFPFWGQILIFQT